MNFKWAFNDSELPFNVKIEEMRTTGFSTPADKPYVIAILCISTSKD